MINHTKQLNELATQQKKTDKEMCKTHNLNMNSLEWFNNRIIALTVEFVETMQVTEDFKDWKIKKGKIDPKRFKKVMTEITSKGVLIGDLYQDELLNELVNEKEALKRTLIEECADALHFVLSLKNLFDYDSEINYYDNISVNQCIVNFLYELMATQQSYLLSNCNVDIQVKSHFSLCLNYLFSYFELINVNDIELINAYWLKNKVNHQRIKEGY